MKKRTNQRTLTVPEITDAVHLRSLRPPTGLISRVRAWIDARRSARPADRRLRVAETVSLGDKRFVAVVQVDGRHFLLAGGPTNIVLLAQLQPHDDFEQVLKNTMTVSPAKKKKPATKKKSKPAKPAEPQSAAFSDLLSAMTLPAPLVNGKIKQNGKYTPTHGEGQA
jgi:flagellar biogenesis protein FliO